MFQQEPKHTPVSQAVPRIQAHLTWRPELTSKCEDPEITSHHVKTLSSSQCEDLKLISVWRPHACLSMWKPWDPFSVKIPSPLDFYCHTDVFSSCWFSLPNLIISASPFPLSKLTRHFAQLLSCFLQITCPFIIERAMNLPKRKDYSFCSSFSPVSDRQ